MTAPYFPPKRTLAEALRAAFQPGAQFPIPADATATPPVRPDFSGVPMAAMRATSAPMPRGARGSGNPAADRLNANLDRGLARLGAAAAPSADTPEGWLREMFSPVRQGVQARELANATGAQMRRAGRTGNVGDAAMAAGLSGLTLASVVPGGTMDDAAKASANYAGGFVPMPSQAKIAPVPRPRMIIFDADGFLERKTAAEMDAVDNHHRLAFSPRAVDTAESGVVVYDSGNGITAIVRNREIGDDLIRQRVRQGWPDAENVSVIKPAASMRDADETYDIPLSAPTPEASAIRNALVPRKERP